MERARIEEIQMSPLSKVMGDIIDDVTDQEVFVILTNNIE